MTVVAGLFEGKCILYDVNPADKKILDTRARIVNVKSSRGKNAKVSGLLAAWNAAEGGRVWRGQSMEG